MVDSPRALAASPSRHRVPEIDLTGQEVQPSEFVPSSPFGQPQYHSMPHLRASPRNFNKAVRRVYTRRERMYDRTAPNKMLGERLEVSEEMPPPELHPARESALTHLSRAYAVAGYAQAALCVVVSAVLVAFIVSFARGMLADVNRKTRHRASGAVRAADLCRRNFNENRCAAAEAAELVHTPALAALCVDWKDCFARADFAERDALSATVWAEAVAETFNAFAERISSTSVVIGLTVAILLLFFMSSAAFGFMHRRLVDDRLSAPLPSPSPVSVARYDEKIRSPYANSGVRPRSITFDPNQSPVASVIKAN